MKKAVWAIWEHRKGIHKNCGQWCNGQNKNQHPNFVLELMKPIFEVLSSDELLKKCLHGQTQNANESFHHIIWDKCPKSTFVGKKRLEIAVFDAVLSYNEGEIGRLRIYDKLNISPGSNCISAFHELDKSRIASSEIEAKAENKDKRAKKRILGVQTNKGDDDYNAGNF
ncbi:hypothetical protein BgiBS90_004420 [Biomphalaria glabrata]|nr:hypothetical protein BgiBS90_004420 [Biomphalaria glabrata]